MCKGHARALLHSESLAPQPIKEVVLLVNLEDLSGCHPRQHTTLEGSRVLYALCDMLYPKMDALGHHRVKHEAQLFNLIPNFMVRVVLGYNMTVAVGRDGLAQEIKMLVVQPSTFYPLKI